MGSTSGLPAATSYLADRMVAVGNGQRFQPANSDYLGSVEGAASPALKSAVWVMVNN